jgi:cobaltochelatase CobT
MNINPRALLVRESIGKIVPMLTSRKVKVTSRGTRAYVEYHETTGQPICVNVPYIPDDAAEEVLDATQGFLDHECGHILFTDFEVLAEAAAKNVKMMHNIVEDPFVESMMAKQFTGSAFNLANTGRYFLKELTEPMLKKATTPEQTASILLVPVVRAWAGQQVFIDFMKDKWHLVDHIVKSVPTEVIESLGRLESSQDCLDAAIEIAKVVGKEPTSRPKPKKSKEKEKPASGGGAEETDEEPDGEEEGDEASDGDTPGSGADGDEESDEEFVSSDGDDDGEDAEGEIEFDDTGAGKSRTETKPTEKSDKEKASKERPKARTDGNGEEYGAAAEEFDKEAFKKALEEIPDYDAGIAKALSDASLKAAEKSEYNAFSTDEDKVEAPKIGEFNEKRVGNLCNAADQLVGPLQKDIERAFAAISQSVWVGGYSSGRMHGPALVRTVFNREDIFRRKQANRSKDIAVELVIDCSGSMSGGKIAVACQAAYALTAVLDRIGIANEVIGFTTKSFSKKMLDSMRAEATARGKSHIRYARGEALYMPVFKAWDERLGPIVKQRLSECATHSAPGFDLLENVDGECVQLAARRLASRREARKIMIVFSDGHPSCSGDHTALHHHLAAVVKNIEASGIDVLGMGIMDHAVKHFYKKHVVITSVGDLPGETMRRIKSMLLR